MVNGIFDDECLLPLDLLIISDASFWDCPDIDISYSEQKISFLLFELCNN
jgi:hypothetical protein